jgi:hypothetical protein
MMTRRLKLTRRQRLIEVAIPVALAILVWAVTPTL